MAVSQLPHFVATDTAGDITAGLDNGCYIAQVRGGVDSFGVFYATADVAPTDDNDYFQAKENTSFVFTVADDVPPTWVKVDPAPAFLEVGYEGIVAIARTDEA